MDVLGLVVIPCQRTCQLTLCEPVLGHPGVESYLVHRCTTLWTRHEHKLHDAPIAWRQRFLEVQSICIKPRARLLVWTTKRKLSMRECIEDDTKTPHVDFERIGLFGDAIVDLGCKVCLRTRVCDRS